jgi:hypothetical protein
MSEHRKNYLKKHYEEKKEHYYQMRLKNKHKKKEYDRNRYLKGKPVIKMSQELIIKITRIN